MVDIRLSRPPHPTPPQSEDERFHKLRLIRSRRIGAQTFHKMMARFGTARAALEALPEVAREAGLRDYQAQSEAVVAAEFRAGARVGARAMFFGDEDYPENLRALRDAPPLLWLLGEAHLLSRPCVALVGARNASSLGLRMAGTLARGLGEAGYVVVSGLARGIDAAAHQAALPLGTIAVQAGGLDRVYPDENRILAEAIRVQGLRLSEQPFGLTAQAGHFPQRNRIVSGLCRAVVVVEAGARSGSLMTARLAGEQGRDVLAVPGHPFDARAAGANQLLRDGAILVRDVADVIEALTPLSDRVEEAADAPQAGRARASGADGHADRGGVSASAAPRTNAASGAQLSSRQAVLAAASALHQAILARLGSSALPEDQLVRELSLPPATVLPELLELEVSGRIRRQPGGLLSQP